MFINQPSIFSYPLKMFVNYQLEPPILNGDDKGARDRQAAHHRDQIRRAGYSEVARRLRTGGGLRRHRVYRSPPPVQFVADSPLEEAVTSELVSEMGFWTHS